MTSSKHETREGTLWGARFSAQPSDALTTISRSPDLYFELLPQDIAGSRAHALELERQDLLTSEECQRLIKTLDEIESDWQAGLLERDESSEDVHGFLEQELIRRVGTVGGKIRAGRSRNDQTANDLRLFMRQKVRSLIPLCRDLAISLIQHAEQHAESHALGFTHLQAAQPITFGHQLLSHAQAIKRDIRRFVNWDIEHATSPLGAAALAGSAIATNPELIAQDLGYERSYDNSIDAVASRDHVAEFLFASSQLMISISRLAEEQIYWASPHLRWVELHDSHATGSSIMPQKKNPDIAELSRGKAGTVMGLLSGFMATQKALPTAYNRDLFEDKSALLHAIHTLELVLPAMAGSIRTMQINEDVMKEQATMAHSLATDIADMLALSGVPFREAHEIVGETVSYCDKHALELTELTSEHLSEVDSRVTLELIEALDVRKSLDKRTGKGSTKPSRVVEQAEALRDYLDSPSATLTPLKGRALAPSQNS